MFCRREYIGRAGKQKTRKCRKQLIRNKMYTTVFFVIAGVLLCLSRVIDGRWLWGYCAGGLAFGLYNEICFEFCWDYSPLLKPMIWRDVPLLVVLGWGLIAVVSLAVSDRISSWAHLKNPWLEKFSTSCFFSAWDSPTNCLCIN